MAAIAASAGVSALAPRGPRPPWPRRPPDRRPPRWRRSAPHRATPRPRCAATALEASWAPRSARRRPAQPPRRLEPPARSPPACRPVYRRSERQLVEPVALDHLAAHPLHGAVHGLVDLEDPAGLPPLLRYARGDLDVLHVQCRRNSKVLVLRLDAERE